MTDKEMIEQMARVNCQTAKYVKVSCNECILNKPCKWFEEAEVLYNAGCRKIPEDSVVLSQSKYNELKSRAEEVFNEMTERMKAEVKIAKKMGVVKGSKETAEKFAEKIQDYLNDKVCEEFGDSACDVTYFTIDVDKVISDVFEISKQFGVDIEE